MSCTNEDELALGRQGSEQGCCQADIEHGCLVYQHSLCRQAVGRAVCIAALELLVVGA